MCECGHAEEDHDWEGDCDKCECDGFIEKEIDSDESDVDPD